MSEREEDLQEKGARGPELVPAAAPEMEMAEFELALTRAMRRVDAPDGFAGRIMERAAKGAVAGSARVRESGPGAPDSEVSRVIEMRPRLRSVRVQAWMGGAIAAALALGMFGAEQLHQRRVRAEKAAIANQQFEAAVQVTDRALAQTREQLQRAGLHLGE